MSYGDIPPCIPPAVVINTVVSESGVKMIRNAVLLTVFVSAIPGIALYYTE